MPLKLQHGVTVNAIKGFILESILFHVPNCKFACRMGKVAYLDVNGVNVKASPVLQAVLSVEVQSSLL